MSNYAVMPKSDYVAACDIIREKTGDTDVIKSGELISKLNDVYNAGAVDLLQNSKYMHPTVSGEIIRIDDMVGVPHKVTVCKRSDTAVDLDAVKVRKYGKNLFTTGGRNKADLGVYDATTQRNITENSYYVGLLSNNYYLSANIISYDISDPTSIRIKAGTSFSGIGFSFRAIPNVTYTVSQSNPTNDKRVRLMFYTQDGTFLSYDVGSFKSCTVAAPETAYWLVVLLCPAVQNTDVYFDNVMLEMSNTNTEYEPYIMEEVGETFESTPNTITLMPDTSGVILDCQYLRDIDKYIDNFFDEE